MKRLVLCAMALIVMAGNAKASEQDTAARAFWKIFVKGDIAELEKSYADKVTLKAGSEFLKPRWGLNPGGNRDKDAVIAKAGLMKAYEATLKKVGKAKWQALWGGVKQEDIKTKILPNKHVQLTVTLRGDAFEYELAPSKDGKRWLVVAERTDY